MKNKEVYKQAFKHVHYQKENQFKSKKKFLNHSSH